MRCIALFGFSAEVFEFTSATLYAFNHNTVSTVSLSLCRNWCAYVVTKTVSCVVEDGVETYVKPDYHPCTWGNVQCSRVLV